MPKSNNHKKETAPAKEETTQGKTGTTDPSRKLTRAGPTIPGVIGAETVQLNVPSDAPVDIIQQPPPTTLPTTAEESADLIGKAGKIKGRKSKVTLKTTSSNQTKTSNPNDGLKNQPSKPGAPQGTNQGSNPGVGKGANQGAPAHGQSGPQGSSSLEYRAPTLRNREKGSSDTNAADSRKNSSTGETKKPLEPLTSQPRTEVRSAHDFKFHEVLSQGSYTTLYRTVEIATHYQYAIKVCQKRSIIREKKNCNLKREKRILILLNEHPSPFFIQLFTTFQTTESLFMVMTYAEGGELLKYLRNFGVFDLECAQFYGSEVLLAMEHMHRLGIVHQDLRLGNILLNDHFHILISNFYSAKLMADEADNNNAERRPSFTGPTKFASPEILNNQATDTRADLWNFGCIVFHMLAGEPPFNDKRDDENSQKVRSAQFTFPPDFNAVARSLVENLLKVDPAERLGADFNGRHFRIRMHQFFLGTQWDVLAESEAHLLLHVTE